MRLPVVADQQHLDWAWLDAGSGLGGPARHTGAVKASGREYCRAEVSHAATIVHVGAILHGPRRSLIHGHDNERQIIMLFGLADPIPHPAGERGNLFRRRSNRPTQQLLQPFFPKLLALGIERLSHAIRKRDQEVPRTADRLPPPDTRPPETTPAPCRRRSIPISPHRLPLGAPDTADCGPR